MSISPDIQPRIGTERPLGQLPDLRLPKHPLREKILCSPLGRVLLATLALGGVAEIVNITNPALIPAGIHWLRDQIDPLLEQSQNLKDNIAKPYSWSGEINPSISRVLSTPEALNIIQKLTMEQQQLYFLLPSQEGIVKFEKREIQPPYGPSYLMIGLEGITSGSTFVSPYNGTLMFTRYEQSGAWSINIRQISKPGESDKKTSIEFIAQDPKLLLPDTLFTTKSIGEPGRRTTYSSETPIRAGQPIFQLTSERFVPGSYGDMGQYNVVVLRADLPVTTDNKIVTLR